MSDPRVDAIRSDAKVGRGTCTSIDEAMTDDELIEALDKAGVKTPAKAVKWAIDDEGLRIENATNFRWGSDDDPELKRLREWNED
jgi:hypothetical protein